MSGVVAHEWDDEALILPLLERDRRWSAYALCDLDPPYRERARIIGVQSADGRPLAMTLLYEFPDVIALLPYGDPSGIRTIAVSWQPLPAHIFYISEDRHLPALAERYALETRETMSRMVLAAPELAAPPSSVLPVKRLSVGDEDEIRELYGLSGSYFLDTLMLGAGIYYGARDGGKLIAVAGTHCRSRRHHVAAIGGVFAHPDYRGRGLATATTGAVARELARQGAELIVLNVRADNVPAVAAYTRLGFRHWLTFSEGRATLR